MLLRLIAAVMIAAAGAVAGFSKADGLRKDLEISRETGELLRMSAIFIRFQGLDVYELSDRLKNSADLHELTFLNSLPSGFSEDENFHDLWKNAVSGQENIPAEERMILLNFGKIVGTSDIPGQLTSIEAIGAELSEIEGRRKENYTRKSRLYRSTGTLFGIMAGILII